MVEKKMETHSRITTGSSVSSKGLKTGKLELDEKKHRFCAIITCDPNKVMHEIHDRMPVILDPRQKMVWLEKGDGGLLKPLADTLTDSWPVSRLVNSPGNNRPDVMNRMKT